MLIRVFKLIQSLHKNSKEGTIMNAKAKAFKELKIQWLTQTQ